MDKSRLLRLNWRDIGEGLVAIVLGSVLASLKEAIDMHSLNVALYDWAMIIEVAISAGATYLFANLFKNSDGVLGGRERR